MWVHHNRGISNVVLLRTYCMPLRPHPSETVVLLILLSKGLQLLTSSPCGYTKTEAYRMSYSKTYVRAVRRYDYTPPRRSYFLSCCRRASSYLHHRLVVTPKQRHIECRTLRLTYVLYAVTTTPLREGRTSYPVVEGSPATYIIAVWVHQSRGIPNVVLLRTCCTPSRLHPSETVVLLILLLSKGLQRFNLAIPLTGRSHSNVPGALLSRHRVLGTFKILCRQDDRFYRPRY